MPSSHRLPSLLALALTGAACAVPVVAASAEEGDAGNEIQIEAGATWKLEDGKVRGSVTNGDRSPVTGSAKLKVRSGRVVVASGGTLSVPAGGRQTVTVKLTEQGRSFFRRRSSATASLVLKVKAGERSGNITTDVTVKKGR